MKITVVPIMIVWLLHGYRLEVMCNLVWIICDANVPVARKKGHQNQKLFLLMKNIWQSLTQRCTESLSTSAVLNCKLYEAPSWTSRLFKNKARVDQGCVLIHLNSHESVFTRHHTEDTNCWCCFFVFLTILYRRMPPPSGIPCQSGTSSVLSVSSCRFLCHLCTTHFPCILS